jgi:hypothetical protein
VLPRNEESHELSALGEARHHLDLEFFRVSIAWSGQKKKKKGSENLTRFTTLLTVSWGCETMKEIEKHVQVVQTGARAALKIYIQT